jgi:uncharacterized Zn finger protein
VAERRRRAEKKLSALKKSGRSVSRRAEKKLSALKKSGRSVSPVVIEGRTIAKTFWGKAWCEHLEGYSDFASRLPRGRTYVRNGSVIDLQLVRGRIDALVSGSEIYTARLEVRPLEPAKWQEVVQRCAGQIESVVELLSGRLSDGVMATVCDRAEGLFPGAKEISLSCSCPDGARLCKHLAAVLYGVGARLDDSPELLFLLRGVDQTELITRAAAGNGLKRPARGAKKQIAEDALAAVFGIDLDEGEPVAAPRRGRPPKKLPKVATKKRPVEKAGARKPRAAKQPTRR